MQTAILTSAATGNLTTLKEIALESFHIIPLVMNKVHTFKLFILKQNMFPNLFSHDAEFLYNLVLGPYQWMPWLQLVVRFWADTIAI